MSLEPLARARKVRRDQREALLEQAARARDEALGALREVRRQRAAAPSAAANPVHFRRAGELQWEERYTRALRLRERSLVEREQCAEAAYREAQRLWQRAQSRLAAAHAEQRVVEVRLERQRSSRARKREARAEEGE